MKIRLLALLIMQPLFLSNSLYAISGNTNTAGGSPEVSIAGTSVAGANSDPGADAALDGYSAFMPPPEISADSAVLMDAKTGVVLYSKYMYKSEYPASITKILTALVALENGEADLNQRINFLHDDVYDLPADSSSIAMNEGDTLSFGDALYGMLMASANEVANAIAEHFGGTINNFVGMMNERAKELGAVNSHFVNPHGLYDPGHYTCAYDMALFMREAVKHPFFDKVISTKSYNIPPTEKQPLERPLNNDDKMIQPGKYNYPGVVGGKTGYTDEAQHTLVTYAQSNGIGLIAVVMHEPGMNHYADTAALLDYGFTCYHDVSLLGPDGYTGSVDVIQPRLADGANLTRLNVFSTGDITGLFPGFIQAGTITLKPEASPGLKAPIVKGDEVGSLEVLYGGVSLGTVPLIAAESVSLAQPAPSPSIQPSPETESIAQIQSVSSPTPAAVSPISQFEIGGQAYLLTFTYIAISAVILFIVFGLVVILVRRVKRHRIHS